MATLIWRAIFAFLVCELVLTCILVLPVPRKIRNYLARKIFWLQLGERLAKPILFIGTALALALVESFWTHQRLLDRLLIVEEEKLALEILSRKGGAGGEYYYGGGGGSGGGGGALKLGSSAAMTMTHHDRERKYKSERNMYLAGFALTLVFVIGRITQLMEENVELEEECDRLQHRQRQPPVVPSSKHGGGAETATTSANYDDKATTTSEVEMKAIRKKPDEKKKD